MTLTAFSVFPNPTAANIELLSEVEPQLAALLAEAQSLGATVVCDRPIYKVDSLLSREAAIGDLQGLLLSPLELCEAMWQAGKLASDVLDQARRLLPNRPWRRERRLTTFDKPIYVDGVAMHLLQDARVLGSVTAAGLDIRIHQEVLTKSRRLARTGAVAERLVQHVEAIRSTLRAAMRNGTASLLTREQEQPSDSDGTVSAWDSTQSLVQGADRYDALCIDERTFNAAGSVPSQTGRAVPIVCTLDVLREMRRRAAISKDEYWTALHRLRRGGFVFVPTDAEELGVRSRQALHDDEVSVESIELRAIREAAARADVELRCTPDESVAIAQATLRSRVRAVRDLWTDPDVSATQAAQRADRLWLQLKEVPLGNAGIAWTEGRQQRQDWLTVALGLLLWPIVVLSEERRRAYGSWLERVMKPLGTSNMHVIRRAARSVRDAMQDHGGAQPDPGIPLPDSTA